MAADPETLLFVRFRGDGDVGALGALYDGTAAELLRVAFHLVRDPARAEDLVQQTFVAAIEGAARFDATRSVRGWLLGILANQAKKLLRDEARVPPAGAEATIDPLAVAQTEEFTAAVDAAISTLPDVYQPVLVLHLKHGMIAAEIAHALRRPPGTVRTQLMRALELLKQALPPSIALGACMLLTPLRGLAAVKANVLENASRHGAVAAASVLGGAALTKKVVTAIACATAFAVGAFVWIENAPAAGDAAHPHERAALVLTAAADEPAAPRATASLQSERVPAPGASGEQDPSARTRTFDDVYADLVALVHETNGARAFAAAQGSGALPPNTRASGLFAEMTIVAPDAGTRALSILEGLPAPWSQQRERAANSAEARVCRLLVDFNLQQMTADERFAAGRSALVGGLLRRMPTSPDFANLGRDMLRRQPYLEAVHEPALLEMSRAAVGEAAFLAAPVKELLQTLWGNLAKSGNTDYSALLAYFEDERSSVTSMAATEQLLTSERYRHLAIARFVATRNETVCKPAALFAARELPFDVAIDVVKALRSVFEHTHFSAYTSLAEKTPQELAKHYQLELELADSTGARHREQLVVALANYTAKELAVPQACLAFDRDPDACVKGVALLGLANRGAVDECQARFDLAIADPLLAVPKVYLVLSLQSIARRCDPNWLDGASTALASLEGHSAADLASIEKLRRDHLRR